MNYPDPYKNDIKQPSSLQKLVKVLIIVFLVIPGVILIAWISKKNNLPKTSVNPINYDQCAASIGSTILKIYPGICVAKNGDRFTQSLTDEEKDSLKPPPDTSTWKTYTNKLGKFSINYPVNWTTKEIHVLSNRVVDDPKEINTTVLSGKEGEIVMQWGPMGFGGGCDDWTTLELQSGTVPVCKVVHKDGTVTWGLIHPPDKNHQPAFGARATAKDQSSADLIETIFSTLEFSR